MRRVLLLAAATTLGCHWALPLDRPASDGPPAGDVAIGLDGAGDVLPGVEGPCAGPCLACIGGVCYVPSNVSAGLLIPSLGGLALTGAITVDTDTGEIVDDAQNVIRPAVTGLDPKSGIAYEREAQSDGTELGVFVARAIQLGKGATLRGVGTRPLVLLAAQTVLLEGVIDVGSVDEKAGPGGFDGGAPGQPGSGACAGQTGQGTVIDSTNYCNSGAGGGGHGGKGGQGGDCTCAAPDNFPGGDGGADTCGTLALVPLVGGSGGGGGTKTAASTKSSPGPGGGGGGAIQISAGVAITLGSTGGINAGGGPGGGCTAAGGAGGGAGGAILLEAPDVSLGNGSVLAANGGGGGGADCA